MQALSQCLLLLFCAENGSRAAEFPLHLLALLLAEGSQAGSEGSGA